MPRLTDVVSSSFQAFRRHWRVIASGVLGVVLVAGSIAAGVSWWAVRQSRQVPDFYARAIDQSDQAMRAARDHLRHDVQKLQDDASRRGSWQARFTEDQINVWLADQLPEKFALWLARGARDPAIAIEDGRLRAAVRYATTRIDTVISCELQVAMTEQPNLLAVRLSNLQAGALPLPLEPFVRRISSEAARGNFDVRWDFTEDGPIALVTIPHDDPAYKFSPVIIESVDLVAGQLTVAGRTGDRAASDYSPRGPVHRFVQFRPRQNKDAVITQ